MHCGNVLRTFYDLISRLTDIDYSAQGGRDRLKMHLLPEESAKMEAGEQKASIVK